MTETYHLPEYNWSVSCRDGRWVLVFKGNDSQIAKDEKIIAAILAHAATNKRKFLEAQYD